MMLGLRHSIALASAALVLAGVATASANNLSVNEREFELTWSEAAMTLTFSTGASVSCPMTLLGHDHNVQFVKEPGQLIGFIDHVQKGNCTGGTATVMEESLPWHETYQGFTGTLPNIDSVLILVTGMRKQITMSVLGIPTTCEITTTEEEALLVTLNVEGGGQVTSAVASGEIDTTDVGGGTSCDLFGITMSISGTGAKTTLGGSEIFVSLI